MSREPVWLERRFIDFAQSDQLEQHIGLPGVRDENALESALARPLNRWTYEPDTTLLQLAAAYGYGLGTFHCFSDGNKRTAFMAMYTFLALNGLEISASQSEVVTMVLGIADGSLDEVAITEWLQGHTTEFVE